MSHFTLQDVRDICGTTAYNKGREYVEKGRVTSLKINAPCTRIAAGVKGSRNYQVHIDLDEFGLDAECTCPAYQNSYYHEGCKHIAAVLIAVHRMIKAGTQSQIIVPDYQLDIPAAGQTQPTSIFGPDSLLSAPPSRRPATRSAIEPFQQMISYRTADQLMELFKQTDESGDNGLSPAGSEFTTTHQEKLQVEYICHVEDSSYKGEQINIEMKIGTRRTYVVQKLRPFLDSVEKGESFHFTKLFSYEPATQYFAHADRQLMELLIHIKNGERMYKELLNPYSLSDSFAGDARAMFIPPMNWPDVYKLLQQCDFVTWEGKGTLGNGQITASDEVLPIEFNIAPGVSGGYKLNVNGLQEAALLPSYGLTVSYGKIFEENPLKLRRLAKMRDTLSAYGGKSSVDISAAQIEPFVQQTLPVLRKAGKVSVDKRVRERIAEPELVSKSFVDREEGKLFVRLEFDYEGILLNPLDEKGKQRADSKMILIRNMDSERRVLHVLESSRMRRNGLRWIATTDDEIFDALYHVLPELEELTEVYISQSARGMRYDPASRPKIKAELTSELDWLNVSFELEGMNQQELRDIMLSVVEKKKYIRLRSGAFLSLEGEEYATYGRMAEELSVKRSDVKGGTVKLPALQALQLSDDIQGASSLRMGKHLRRFLERLRHPERLEYDPPESLANVLRDYQVQGFQWLKSLSFFRFGGILADDMGLGKTLQTIAYICSELDSHAEIGKQTDKSSSPAQASMPVLIVTPASLTYNWENEFKRFAPHVRVEVVAGQKGERSGLLATVEGDQGPEVIITSYPLLRRDFEWYENKTFSTLILDEAQAIKNAGSLTAQLVKQLSAPRRFALTGTPIENSLEELWSIFDAVFPGLFSGRKSFRDIPREQLARMVSPFILRRLKEDVLEELPDKIETVQRSELSGEQKKLYAAYLSQLRDDTIQDLQTNGFQKSRMKILAGITRLRQLCCHPSLFVEDYQGSSGKMEQLLETVAEARASGRRMLVFSQFTSMLDIIRSALEKEGAGVFYLSGSTPARDRVDMCRRFNEGENDVFLISLKAGGTGLNLTGADTVILYDLWWNPAVEEQAAGRAHRMGQKRVVQVIRLVAEGTIEETMLELQQRKKDLIKDVLDPAEGPSSTLTEEDIRELLRV
ncbi:DEAD/DEAH box helicase [Paenibacillus maysiensis]|uniref:DEAD/DEAH box helicase n=1 Tax=Paenibacillus maysiensis TaxID=1155954 RepID=UPI00046EEC41|nr:DEAD/DEAH box helicase [Paenibacillus maysiensis]